MKLWGKRFTALSNRRAAERCHTTSAIHYIEGNRVPSVLQSHSSKDPQSTPHSPTVPLVFVLILFLQGTVSAYAVSSRPCPSGQCPLPLRASGRPRYESPHPAVARIVVPDQNGISYGSGTLIDLSSNYGLVVTNWHVVRDAEGHVEVQFPDGFRSLARPLKVDPNWDLAALVIWRPAVDPVPLAKKAPRPGDVLTIAGYGRGTYRSATGRCTQYVAPGLNFPFEMVEVNVSARQGDSGGPIFNSEGELAGVLFGSGRGTTSGSFCGRVEGFLASLVPNLGQRDDAQVAANSNRNIPYVARRLASVPLPELPSKSRAEPRVSKWTEDSVTRPSVAAVSAMPTASDQTMTCREFAGETVFEQAKTVLAMFGALGVLFLVARLTTR